MLALTCLASTTTPLQADFSNTDIAPQTAPLNLWVKSAPMSLLVEQLAQLSGQEAELTGTLDMPVSGRFNGSLEQTLVQLAANYPVLFDLGDGTLHASDSSSGSSISIAAVSSDLDDALKQSLFEDMAAGNDVEIRADAVRVSGHPAFVNRIRERILRALADGGARLLTEQNSDEEVPAAASPTLEVEVIDAGSNEMLADIADESKPPRDQATLSKPIRWVTDIPGFHTF